MHHGSDAGKPLQIASSASSAYLIAILHRSGLAYGQDPGVRRTVRLAKGQDHRCSHTERQLHPHSCQSHRAMYSSVCVRAHNVREDEARFACWSRRCARSGRLTSIHRKAVRADGIICSRLRHKQSTSNSKTSGVYRSAMPFSDQALVTR